MMAKRAYDIMSLLDIHEWEMIQDRLAELTNTAIITIDIKGNPVTKHSGRTEFCTVLRENPVLRKRCLKCDALAGLEAVRLERPYIYLCHCGIVDVAVPVIAGEQYIGAVMFGEVRLPECEHQDVSRLVGEISNLRADLAGLEEKYQKLPVIAYDRIVRIANVISAVVNSFVNQNLKHLNELQLHEHILRRLADVGEDVLESAAFTAAPESEEGEIPAHVRTSPIYPAVVYINRYRSEMVSMNEMAELCHLSTSYFSRLFSRVMGENFTSYVNRRKIDWCKEELRSGNASVEQIAMDYGFLNSSYFINVFKRHVGITPLLYRKQANKRI